MAPLPPFSPTRQPLSAYHLSPSVTSSSNLTGSINSVSQKLVSFTTHFCQQIFLAVNAMLPGLCFFHQHRDKLFTIQRMCKTFTFPYKEFHSVTKAWKLFLCSCLANSFKIVFLFSPLKTRLLFLSFDFLYLQTFDR